MSNIFRIIVFLMLIQTLYLPLFSKEGSLINTKYVVENLTFSAPYHECHGATGSYLGAGLLYYAIAYATKAKVCVCLGSGGGFVPRVMKQAQRDLEMGHGRTILIDGDIGNFGRPLWRSNDSFFRQDFPDIEIKISLTHDAAIHLRNKKISIDYLHIDADHTEEGCFQDFLDYLPLMSKHGYITIHDTGDPESGPANAVKRIKSMGYQVVDFPNQGTGFSLITLL